MVWQPGLALLDVLHVTHHGLDTRLFFSSAIGLWLFVVGMFVVRVSIPAVSWFGRISYPFCLTHQAGLYSL